MPSWVEENSETINTGNDVVDQIITVMLSTSMFIAGTLGFILDNTIPGTLEERGVIAWKSQSEPKNDHDIDDSTVTLDTYDIPFVTKYLVKWSWTKYVPCFPTFKLNDSSIFEA